MKNKTWIIVVIASLGLIIAACGMMNKKNKGKGMNLFTVSQDREFGAQVAAEIEGNPAQYPILDSARNKEAYGMLYRLRDLILNSGEVDFKEDFAWRLRIIKDDSTLNAFCTPGGYIYVYTGILKYLENEAQLAGVMAHEIAHADQRHSTRQMTKMFGVQVLLEIIAGNRAMIKEVTGALVNLRNSRAHETEADYYSVAYLCPTPYDAAGGAGFFEKIQRQDAPRPPEFLSTHPDPGKRIEKFYTNKIALGCTGADKKEEEYKRIVSKL